MIILSIPISLLIAMAIKLEDGGLYFIARNAGAKRNILEY